MNAEVEIDVLDSVPVEPDFAMLALLVLRETRWTQSELAARLGCVQATVSRILEGHPLRCWYAGARLLNLSASLVSERDFARCTGRPEPIVLERIETAEPELPETADPLGLLLTLRERGYSTAEVARELDIPPNSLGTLTLGRSKELTLSRGLRVLNFARRVLPAELYRQHVSTEDEIR